MLYTWAINLAGVEGAAVLGWVLGIVAIAGLIGYLNSRLGALPAWVGAAALTAGFTYSSSLAWAYVDWLLVLFGVGTLISLDRWITNRQPGQLMLVGILTGMALGSKYTGGVLLVAVIVVVVSESMRRKVQFNQLVANLIALVMPAVLVTLPWWIKNVWATGNPFYPFFIPAGAMDRFRLDFYNVGLWGDWRDTIFLPILASLTGVEGASGYNASIGPLLLGLSACAIVGWPEQTNDEKDTLRIAALLGLSGVLLWIVAARLSGLLIQSRLYAAIFPALAVLAGAGYKSLTYIHWGGIRLGRVVGTLILLVYTFSVLDIGRYTVGQGASQVILGLKAPQVYQEENLGWYSMAMRDIRSLPDGSKVLMLWEPRSLYCLPNCLPDEIIDRWKHDMTIWRTPDAILNSWRSSGYTHLLFYRLGADFVRSSDARYAPSDWQTLDLLLSRLSPPMTDYGAAYSMYKLK